MQSNFGERLKSARKMAGMSLQALADRAEISKQAISKYENGRMKPSGEVLLALSKALNVKIEYFFTTPRIDRNAVSFGFRKHSAHSKKAESWLIEKAITFADQYLELMTLLNEHWEFDWNCIRKKKIQTRKDAEEAAAELRQSWNLGLAPVGNIVQLLESRNIIVYQIESHDFPDVDLVKFDGMAFKVESYPVVVVKKAGTDEDRARFRFTAIHELAHLLLDFDPSISDTDRERMCDAFSGAFFLPEEAAISEFGKKRDRMTIEEFARVKRMYGISIQATMMRIKGLGIPSDSLFESFWKVMNQRGWKKTEPEKYLENEEATRYISMIIRAVAEEVITVSKASTLSGLKIDTLNEKMQARL